MITTLFAIAIVIYVADQVLDLGLIDSIKAHFDKDTIASLKQQVVNLEQRVSNLETELSIQRNASVRPPQRLNKEDEKRWVSWEEKKKASE